MGHPLSLSFPVSSLFPALFLALLFLIMEELGGQSHLPANRVPNVVDLYMLLFYRRHLLLFPLILFTVA